jgi:hypothetical protein
MKKRFRILSIVLVALLATAIILVTQTRAVPCRTVKLVISGSEGQRFTGSYTTEGMTNNVKAVVPATLSFQARNVDFEFQREAGEGEFRVALQVDGMERTSTTSGKFPGVRGRLRYAADHESYSSEKFGK